MRIIGLTGGAGMGKSTISGWCRRHAIPVFDADRTVHRLQAKGGAAVAAIANAFPGVVIDGAVCRRKLRDQVIGNPAALRRLEQIVHPLVRRASARFVQKCRRAGQSVVILDIPLLFETGADRLVDQTICVTAPATVQNYRLRLRGLSQTQIDRLIAQQLPDRQKRRRATFLIRTGLSRQHSVRQLHRILTNPHPPKSRRR